MKRRFLFLIAAASLLAIISCAKSSVGPELAYYKETYEENRSAFRVDCAAIKGSESVKMVVPSKTESDLTIDTCYLPPAKSKDKLIILTSGVHGIEAFASSAVQRYVMNEILPKTDRSNLGILIVHAVNPFGFKKLRRVTENNVDLNRNFDTDPALFKNENTGYGQLNEFLNPEGKAEPGSFSNRFFLFRSIFKVAQSSTSVLRQAILQGQYQYPKGIYFGGSGFEKQKSLLEPLFISTSAPYKFVMTIDLHTGYGARGKMHFFPNAIKDPDKRALLEKVYSGYQVDYGDTTDFYTVTGDFTEYVGKLMKNKSYIPMVFEFGTLDSQTTTGSIKSLHNMVLENQGFWNGYENESDMKEVQHRIREHYFPSDPEWRMQVMRTTAEVFPVVLDRFSKL